MASSETRSQLPEPSLTLEDIFGEIQDDLDTVELQQMNKRRAHELSNFRDWWSRSR